MTMQDSKQVYATIKELQGKHYGTTIRVHHPSGKLFGIDVWCPIGAPSEADLEDWGISTQEWKNNVDVPDGWGGFSPVQEMFPCDGHYQSQFESDLVDVIVDAINKWGAR